MFIVPDLPYDYDALEPTISAETLQFHHDKHHATYVKTLNELLGDRPAQSLEDVVRDAAAAGEGKLFNNAAQAWNHGFFWTCMSPDGDGPHGDLEAAIEMAFGTLEVFKAAFVKDGAAHFGSGWVWLVAKAGKLAIETTHDAHDMLTETPVMPLLVCDLWEHAYYLDYQNDRKAFLEAWIESVANWKFATAQWRAAEASEKGWRYPRPAPAAAKGA